MDLRLFGGLRVRAGGVAGNGAVEVDLGGPRQRFVLALLAIESNRVVSSERLIELVWPEASDKKTSSLQAYISNLRKALAAPAVDGVELVRQPPGYRLVIDRSAIDVTRFEDLVLAGRSHAEAGSASTALAAFNAAIGLWTAPPLPEFADEPVVVHAVARWHNLLGVALESSAQLHLDAGDAQAALLLIEPRIEEFPLRERLHGLAALGLYRTGRQTEALRLIERTRQSLVDSSGLDIGEELTDLERRILAQDPTLQLTNQRPTPDRLTPLDLPVVGPPLVGRETELAVLRSALAAAAGGRGGVVTVNGQPGIGKSALVERFTDLAASTGCPVAWARSPQGTVTPPFWPLVQIESQLHDSGALPDDAAVLADVAQPDPFLFAQRLAATFRRAAGVIVVVLDDLQWADEDTLRVVTHLVAELRRTRVLMVVTAHPLSPDAGEDLTACTGELVRQRIADVGLGELARDDVRQWLADRCERAVSDDVVSDLFERTGGNPLFVRELVELIAPGTAAAADDGSLRSTLAAVPAGLVAVVRRRVAQLPGAVQQLLTAASVLGTTGEVAMLADVVGMTADEALENLARATAAGLISVDNAADAFRFSHGIVAQALAAEVTVQRRADIHAAAARSAVRRHPDDEHSALVAHHAAAGAVAGTSALAIESAARAARLAELRGATVDAAHHWRLVAAMLERFRPEDRASRVDALIAAAQGHERADQMDHALELVIAALELNLVDRDPVAIERAASVVTHVSVYPNQAYGEINAALIALLSRCLDALPEVPTSARATVLCALATELFHSDDVEWRDRAITEAAAIARQLDDPVVLARVLHAQTFALKAPELLPDRRRAVDELAALARTCSLGDDIRLVAEHNLVLADYSLGDIPAAHERLIGCLAMLDRPVNEALRSQLGFFRALIELVRGRYADSATHFEEAIELFRRSRPMEADAYRLGRAITVGYDLGGIPEHCFELARADEVGGYGLAWRLYTAVILFDLQRPDDALQRIPYARGSAPDRADDYTRQFVDAATGFIAAETADTVGAELILQRLLPIAGRWAAGGSAALSLGLVDLAIARLFVTIGDHEQAETWFAAAVAGHDRCGSPAWLARSLLHQGRFWLDTGRKADGLVALDRAASIAAAYRLEPVAAQIHAVRV